MQAHKALAGARRGRGSGFSPHNPTAFSATAFGICISRVFWQCVGETTDSRSLTPSNQSNVYLCDKILGFVTLDTRLPELKQGLSLWLGRPETHYVVQDGLKLMAILLPQTLKCWDSGQELSCLAYQFLSSSFWLSYVRLQHCPFPTRLFCRMD